MEVLKRLRLVLMIVHHVLKANRVKLKCLGKPRICGAFFYRLNATILSIERFEMTI